MWRGRLIGKVEDSRSVARPCLPGPGPCVRSGDRPSVDDPPLDNAAAEEAAAATIQQLWRQRQRNVGVGPSNELWQFTATRRRTSTPRSTPTTTARSTAAAFTSLEPSRTPWLEGRAFGVAWARPEQGDALVFGGLLNVVFPGKLVYFIEYVLRSNFSDGSCSYKSS